MKPAPVTCLGALSLSIGSLLFGADTIPSRSTYAQRYGETKTPVAVDPSRDLPRYPAVEPKNAIATWQVKKGFKLELAAHEPQVRDPIAICFDEHGRMFVCEMIDYSEMRDVTPHLGRVSMLEDKDADGYFETSTVFADDLAWPTGLIWANGGLFVGATPDIWFLKDSDGDGKAEIREKVFTGFGTGLKMLNVQGLMNSFQWGLDNRIHILVGGGNRGKVKCLKRNTGSQPVRPSGVSPETETEIEIGGKDFWFDPRTFEFGLEGGGAQYGMSFDNYGRKFGCSNSDHLQYWVYDDRYAARNPYFQMPPARQSIAVDGGAAEVFRISPDEPWRIIRTRWRIAGVVKGVVEGGGRVSGYFTGATGTTIYRGDAYGPEFVNNSFTGDAGGQLVHRKIIKPSLDGVSLIGERPADERDFEFAASKDTWVRVVNFANAPDGCLHICDMYREVIEHPWSIPDEIKRHLDLNSGNDRGRIYRIVPDRGAERIGQRVNLADASTEDLVKLLSHPNGWHRDTAQRLLYERQNLAAVPLLKKVLDGDDALAKLHVLGALQGLGALDESLVIARLRDADEFVRSRAVQLSAANAKTSPAMLAALTNLDRDRSPRVRFELARRLGRESGDGTVSPPTANTLANLLIGDPATFGSPAFSEQQKWLVPAVASAPPQMAASIFSVLYLDGPQSAPHVVDGFAPLLKIAAAHGDRPAISRLIANMTASGRKLRPTMLRALLDGLRASRIPLDEVDTGGAIATALASAVNTATDRTATDAARIEAIDLIGLATSKEAQAALLQCLGDGQSDAVRAAAITTLAAQSSKDITVALLRHWPHYGAKAKAAALDALLARDDRVIALLESGVMKPAEFSAAQVQALIKHKNEKISRLAKNALASVIPPSREEMAAKFKPALVTRGDATRGQNQFISRCMACHRAGAMGLQIGPDLITVKTKGREALLTAILEPHKEVAPQFIAYVVNTKDGQTLTGIIADDNASSMTLKMMGGLTQTVQRSNIKASSSSGQSLMPEGLETGMSVQDMSDLLDYIESLK